MKACTEYYITNIQHSPTGTQSSSHHTQAFYEHIRKLVIIEIHLPHLFVFLIR